MNAKTKKYLKWGIGGFASLLIIWFAITAVTLINNTNRLDLDSDSEIEGIFMKGTFDGQPVEVTSCEALQTYVDRLDKKAEAKGPLAYLALPDADKLERVETIAGCFIIKKRQ